MTARVLVPWALLAISATFNFLYLTRPAPPPDVAAALPTAVDAPPRPIGGTPIPDLASTPAPDRAEDSPPTFTERSRTYEDFVNTLRAEATTPTEFQVLNQIVARWMTSDPWAASTWLDAQRDVEHYGPALATTARFLVADGDLAAAEDWARSIADPALRTQTLESIITEAHRVGTLDDNEVRTSGLPEPGDRRHLVGRSPGLVRIRVPSVKRIRELVGRSVVR